MKLLPRWLLPMKLQMFWQTKSCLHPIKDQRLRLQSIRDVLCKIIWQGLIFCCILCIRNGRRTLVFNQITFIFLISALDNWGWSTSPKIFRNLKWNRIVDCYLFISLNLYLLYIASSTLLLIIHQKIFLTEWKISIILSRLLKLNTIVHEIAFHWINRK